MKKDKKAKKSKHFHKRYAFRFKVCCFTMIIILDRKFWLAFICFLLL